MSREDAQEIGLRHSRRRALFSRALCATTLAVFTLGSIISTYAKIRGPGKYCGVVVFDRWDSCALVKGSDVTYISKRVKNELRPFKGKAIEIDASDVSQPINPGEALVLKYTIIGSIFPHHQSTGPAGLELAVESHFGPRNKPTFLIKIRNKGVERIEINIHDVGPVVFGAGMKGPFGASDDESEAKISDGNLVFLSSMKTNWDGVRTWASYKIEPKSRPRENLQLEPGQSFSTSITLNLSAGKYQFMFGYGDEMCQESCLVSNAISFDISKKGIATLAY
jgi:hypothetical protein